jgi:hypothetical protein
MEAAKTVADALDEPEPKRFRTVEEVALEMHQRGMSSGLLHHLADKLAAWESTHSHVTPMNNTVSLKLLERPDRRD